MLLVVGIGLTLLGADLMVAGAVNLARALGVSDAIIGLTIVAIGTSASCAREPAHGPVLGAVVRVDAGANAVVLDCMLVRLSAVIAAVCLGVTVLTFADTARADERPETRCRCSWAGPSTSAPAIPSVSWVVGP